MFVLVLVLLVIAAVVFLFCLIYGGETQNDVW